MKIRTDFVTNSSSLSFIAVNVSLKNGAVFRVDLNSGEVNPCAVDLFDVQESFFEELKSGEDLIAAVQQWFESSFEMYLELDDYDYSKGNREKISKLKLEDIEKIELSSGLDVEDWSRGNYISYDYKTKSYVRKNRSKYPLVTVGKATVEALLCNPGSASERSTEYARKISGLPDSVTFNGKNFVHTDCLNDILIERYIKAHGGTVRSSVVLATDYLIVGNRMGNETTKYKRAAALNAQGKSIIALTESEFWTLAAMHSENEP